MEPASRQSSSSSYNARKRPRIAEENRARATKACDRCRRLKEKCEGGVPCIKCSRSNRSCEFIQLPKSSQQRTSTSGNIENDERIKYLEKIATHFLGDVSLNLSSLRGIAEKIEATSTTGNEGPIHMDSDVEDLTLKDDKFVVKTLSRNTAHYSGEFSHWNFSQKIRKKVDEYLEGTCATQQKRTITENWRAKQLQSPASNVFALLQSLPPPHVVDFLVVIYFQYAQTNTSFIDQKFLREKLAVLLDTPSIVAESDAGWVCSVLMVLAIGAQFAHMASGPLTQVNENETAEQPPEDDVGVELYRLACKLIPDVIAIASFESVQACLLLAHYALPIDTQGIAYTYLGLAIKIAIQNGMHRKYLGKDFDAHTVETRNRLWWTAYTLEKRICILHGRPPSVTSNDVDADLPVNIPELQIPGEPSRFQNNSALIQITKYLSDISNAISLLRKCPSHLRSNYFDQLFKIRSEAQTWWSLLPSEIYCRDLDPELPLFRQNIHLKLCFHLNEIYMGRPFIFFADTRSPSPRGGNDSTPTDSTSLLKRKRKNTRATLIADAESAALHVIELCSLLNQNCGLAGASYTEFSSCRAALLAILAQSLNGRKEALKSPLALGMRLIRCMATNIDSVKSEVSVIEALETAIRILDVNGDFPNGSAKKKDNGFEKFKSWAALRKLDQFGSDTMQSQPAAQRSSEAESLSWAHSSAYPETASTARPTVDSDLIGFEFGAIDNSFILPELDSMLEDP
ncbi:c6 zinc finger domain-containing protein [Cadophora sp. MPI-SDFR-AT-0126]|nr:c6 zinc finger domain-containing protein [Leotiomycetes sp. MPI-SDFR-AT-0126]